MKKRMIGFCGALIMYALLFLWVTRSAPAHTETEADPIPTPSFSYLPFIVNHWPQAIAFVSWRDGNAEIYVMNTDGSGQTCLTVSPAEDLRPVWSP
jgi:hypothetical protein